MSILSRLLIILVIYNEIKYYFDTSLIFRFEPDVDIQTHIKFNLDMVVKMPCKNIGADILDSTNQNTFSFGVYHFNKDLIINEFIIKKINC